jgi:hypothetical protein
MRISRRALLMGTLAVAPALTVTDAFGSVSRLRRRPASGVAPVTIPTVSPGAPWNGTAGTGFTTTPTDPTRTTAKPAAQWWLKQHIRFGDGNNLIVGVDAVDVGGVSYVDFYVENIVQRVTSPSVFQDVNPYDGSPRFRWGYWIYISNSACLAVTSNATGALNVYAWVQPADATKQRRVIGPMTVYAALHQYDWTANINPTNSQVTTGNALNFTYSYQTITAALNALSTAVGAGTAECGDIKFTQSGSYEARAAAATTGHAGKGLSRLRCDTSISATIFRGASFDPTRGRTNSTTTLENAENDPWTWVYPVSNIEFVGSGLTIDTHNFYQFSNRTSLNDTISFSCNVINSSGTIKNSYWCGDASAGLVTAQQGEGVVNYSYGDCARISYCGFVGSSGFLQYNWGVQSNSCLGTPNNNPHFIVGAYYANAPQTNEQFYHDYGGPGNSGYTATTPLLTITYSGSSVTAWIDLSGIPSSEISLYTGDAAQANPVLVHTYHFNATSTRGQQLVESDTNGWDYILSVTADIHSGRFPGWDATYVDTLNRNFMAQRINGHDFTQQLTSTGGGGSVTPSALGAGCVLACIDDLHSEFVHYQGGSSFENTIVRDVTVVNAEFGSAFLFQEAASLLKDAYWINVAYDGHGNSTSPSQWCGSNCVLANCAFDRGFNVSSGQSDGYTAIINCVGSLLTFTGATDIIISNVVAFGGTIALADSTHTTYAEQFNGATSGDFSPKTASVLYTHTVNRLAWNLYDNVQNPFAFNDVAGPLAIGSVAPIWPF